MINQILQDSIAVLWVVVAGIWLFVSLYFLLTHRAWLIEKWDDLSAIWEYRVRHWPGYTWNWLLFRCNIKGCQRRATYRYRICVNYHPVEGNQNEELHTIHLCNIHRYPRGEIVLDKRDPDNTLLRL